MRNSPQRSNPSPSIILTDYALRRDAELKSRYTAWCKNELFTADVI